MSVQKVQQKGMRGRDVQRQDLREHFTKIGGFTSQWSAKPKLEPGELLQFLNLLFGREAMLKVLLLELNVSGLVSTVVAIAHKVAAVEQCRREFLVSSGCIKTPFKCIPMRGLKSVLLLKRNLHEQEVPNQIGLFERQPS